MSSVSFKNATNKLCLQTIYIHMYKQYLALNNLQRLRCHKNQSNNSPTRAIEPVRVPRMSQIDLFENY